MIARREFITLLGGATAWPIAAQAQLGTKVWRIGILDTLPRELNTANIAALQRGLRELGYVEGQNLVIESRSDDGHNDRIPNFVSELLRLNVDLFVTRSTPAALAIQAATSSTPVIMAANADPVGSGLVASLAHPGGNFTGLSSFHTELEAKRVELLNDMLPGIKRVATIRDFSNPTTTAQWAQLQQAARSLAIEIDRFDVRRAIDLVDAFAASTERQIQGLVIGVDSVTSNNLPLIVDLAARYRQPVIYADREFVDGGGLMAYGVSYPALYYRAATFVDKIFKGGKPADLPVELPTKLEFVVNLKTAKALGLTVPPSLLTSADEVIE
jgi:putative ABC transport system substrate-binding protein